MPLIRTGNHTLNLRAIAAGVLLACGACALPSAGWAASPEGLWIEEDLDLGTLKARVLRDFEPLHKGLDADEDAYRKALMERGTPVEKRARAVIHPRYTTQDLTLLGETDKQELDKLLEGVRGKDGLRLHVVGHTNDVPLSPENRDRYGDNERLSTARAVSVAEYLRQKLGGDASITHEGRGGRDAGGLSPERRRRVEITVHYQQTGAPSAAPALGVLPADFQPWWQKPATQPIQHGAKAVDGQLDSLFLRALGHSSQIKVFSEIPLIRETAVLEAEGAFDPHVFAEAMLKRTDEPVGSTLSTGGPNRFEEHAWLGKAGLRKKTITGATVEASQRVGGTDNNSTFFIPHDQANSRFEFSVTQPLLNGGGTQYNRSTVTVAKLDEGIADAEFRRQAEAHLLEIGRSYWALYLERSILLQKQRLAARAGEVVAQIQGRRGVDVLESEIARARAALGARQSDLMRASMAVRNAEAKLISLINDPKMRLHEGFELVTRQAPALFEKSLTVEQAAQVALNNRPEVMQGLQQIRAAEVRARMSRNELLPILNFIAKLTWDGLKGNYNYDGAVSGQFSEGGPGWTLGLQFDYPLGNTTAEARHRRRLLEVRQVANQLRTTLETILLETQVAIREVRTSWRELGVKYHTLQAANQELDAHTKRGVLVGEEGQRASDWLERLLSAQERVADVERDFLNSQVSYNLALINLDRVTGLLLQTRRLTPTKGSGDDNRLYDRPPEPVRQDDGTMLRLLPADYIEERGEELPLLRLKQGQ
jgi:outer membrane protein TolC